MSRRAQENIAALAFLVLFAGAIVLSLEFGPRARMIPLPLALFGAALAAVQLAWQNLGSTDALKMEMIEVEKRPALSAAGADTPADANSIQSAIAEPTWRARVNAYGIVVGLLALTLIIGPLPAVFVFTLGYFVATRYCAPLWALTYTAILTAVMYLLFFVALQIQPYHGLLAPLFARFE